MTIFAFFSFFFVCSICTKGVSFAPSVFHVHCFVRVVFRSYSFFFVYIYIVRFMRLSYVLHVNCEYCARHTPHFAVCCVVLRCITFYVVISSLDIASFFFCDEILTITHCNSHAPIRGCIKNATTKPTHRKHEKNNRNETTERMNLTLPCCCSRRGAMACETLRKREKFAW